MRAPTSLSFAPGESDPRGDDRGSSTFQRCPRWWPPADCDLSKSKQCLLAAGHDGRCEVFVNPMEAGIEALKEACDRSWADETPEQVAMIAANGLHWRNEEIARLEKHNRWLTEILAGRTTFGPLEHLTQCLTCQTVGTPLPSYEHVCGNCGSRDVRVWSRPVVE